MRRHQIIERHRRDVLRSSKGEMKSNNGNSVSERKRKRQKPDVRIVGSRKVRRVYTLEEQYGQKEHTLDANTIMDRYDAVFTFKENDVRIPLQVLLELDKNKKGSKTRNANARGGIRLLLSLVESVPMERIHDGIPLVNPDDENPLEHKVGKLYFALPEKDALRNSLSENNPDHRILIEFIERDKMLTGSDGRKKVTTLVSNDKLMRILALLIGIPAEEYINDAKKPQEWDGVHRFPYDFWENIVQEKDSEGGYNHEQSQYVKFKDKNLRNLQVHDFVDILGAGPRHKAQSFIIHEKPSREVAVFKKLINYRNANNAVFGIRAKNEDQNRALNVLMDPSIQIVLIEGKVGSGKDILTLAAAYDQMVHHNRYSKIIACRDLAGVDGDNPGWFPGDMQAKVRDWMSGIKDNVRILERIFVEEHFSDLDEIQTPYDFIFKGPLHKQDKRKKKSKVDEKREQKERFTQWMRSSVKYGHLGILRGATYYDDWVIYDEAQNGSRNKLKLFLTRLGEHGKLVLLGSYGQNDQYYTPGEDTPFGEVLTKLVGKQGIAKVILPKPERHRLVDHVDKML